MDVSKQDIDLSILPEAARKELVDFYQFLVQKYGTKKQHKSNRFDKFLSNPIKVNKINIPSRDELHER